ncbi:hypothetical protein N7488_010609 [Penicillium malachiteum]|nr:hypothetical protein N7488_010609 [Penicillium malachiteum]
MSTRPKRSRLAVGCQRCRGDVNSQVCRHCLGAGVQCDRTTIRFRSGLALPKSHNDAFPDQNNWPRIHGKVRFHDETPEIVSQYVGSLDADFCWVDEAEKSPIPENQPNANAQVHNPELPQTHLEDVENNSLSQLPYDPIDVSPSSVSFYSTTSHRSRASSKPFKSYTVRESILIRNFVGNMALWADITDPHRHFEIDVPIRAFHEPVLRNAIFAFSSRHLNRQTANDSTEALQYHNLCVQILIPALSDPEEHITEDILAAVAILRQHEEMDGEDNQFHLTGTTHILNTVSTFGSSGGLGEAAAWLCLRQDIYVSLTTQQPLRTNLENFHDSDIFHRDDDFACSSRMVFLLAKVLQTAFLDSSTVSLINEEVEEWFRSKPESFEPVRVVPSDSELGCRFPIIWMLLPVHVIGLQYYHMAKIVLALSESSQASSTYESLRHSRMIEKNVRHHLLTILGLAESNPRAENTLFTARHSLVAWGWMLRHSRDQSAAESLLRDMHSRTGWNMDSLIRKLHEQWQDEAGLN